jgi:hypothetical protein
MNGTNTRGVKEPRPACHPDSLHPLKQSGEDHLDRLFRCIPKAALNMRHLLIVTDECVEGVVRRAASDGNALYSRPQRNPSVTVLALRQKSFAAALASAALARRSHGTLAGRSASIRESANRERLLEIGTPGAALEWDHCRGCAKARAGSFWAHTSSRVTGTLAGFLRLGLARRSASAPAEAATHHRATYRRWPSRASGWRRTCIASGWRSTAVLSRAH